MKALVYLGPNQKSLNDRPKPAITLPSDIIVKITRTTICGTDLHILKGDVPTCKPGSTVAIVGSGPIGLADILQAYQTFAKAAETQALKVIIEA